MRRRREDSRSLALDGLAGLARAHNETAAAAADVVDVDGDDDAPRVAGAVHVAPPPADSRR